MVRRGASHSMGSARATSLPRPAPRPPRSAAGDAPSVGQRVCPKTTCLRRRGGGPEEDTGAGLSPRPRSEPSAVLHLGIPARSCAPREKHLIFRGEAASFVSVVSEILKDLEKRYPAGILPPSVLCVRSRTEHGMTVGLIASTCSLRCRIASEQCETSAD
ncbi:hypothetical protein NFJ02_03g105040 [Pycnococcus provasolii]